jgi:hypothetical protein
MEEKQMLAALILVISGAMLAQFVVFFWRANMVNIAAQPVSDHLRAAEASFTNALSQNGFSTLTAMSEMCPSMGSSDIKLWPVRSYHRAMRSLAWLCEAAGLTQTGAWAQLEMAACTQYVAVSMDLRLESNRAMVAELRSY